VESLLEGNRDDRPLPSGRVAPVRQVPVAPVRQVPVARNCIPGGTGGPGGSGESGPRGSIDSSGDSGTSVAGADSVSAPVPRPTSSHLDSRADNKTGKTRTAHIDSKTKKKKRGKQK
jgi:hypothetical protein